MVGRMQSTIELGRKIRDNKNISIKNPLSKVTIVEADKQAVEDFQLIQSYIKDELNCLELVVESNENAFVNFVVEPDNKIMGQALMKAYTKQFKEKIINMSKEQALELLQNGQLVIDGITIEKEWVKISKKFTDEYA